MRSDIYENHKQIFRAEPAGSSRYARRTRAVSVVDGLVGGPGAIGWLVSGLTDWAKRGFRTQKTRANASSAPLPLGVSTGRFAWCATSFPKRAFRIVFRLLV